jgi:DNA-binding transcriptional regulator YiaG
MTTSTASPAAIPLIDLLRARREARGKPELPDRARRRALRKAVGASVNDIARTCGVSGFAVNSWERPDKTTEPQGENRRTYKRVLDDLEQLAREFGIDLDQK